MTVPASGTKRAQFQELCKHYFSVVKPKVEAGRNIQNPEGPSTQ